jgi:hypothetical protein
MPNHRKYDDNDHIHIFESWKHRYHDSKNMMFYINYFAFVSIVSV